MVLTLAKLSNFLVLLWLLFMIVTNPPVREEFWVYFLLVPPAISLMALFGVKEDKIVKDVWPFILFRRLALQEKKKIEALEK